MLSIKRITIVFLLSILFSFQAANAASFNEKLSDIRGEINRDNLEEAIKLIEQAVRLRPRSGYFVDSLGWVHYKLGNYDLAVAFLEKATILEPMDAVITGHLGDAYWETGRYAEARFKWQYALTIATENELKAEFTAKLKQ